MISYYLIMQRIVIGIEGQNNVLFKIYPADQQIVDDGILVTRISCNSPWEKFVLPSPVPKTDFINALMAFETVKTRDGIRRRTITDAISIKDMSLIVGVIEGIPGARVLSRNLRVFPD